MLPRNNTVSVCMIVKNEIDIIEDSIRRLLPHFDEIIVVDTGSTDGTFDKVYDLEHEVLVHDDPGLADLHLFDCPELSEGSFDFGEARNWSIDYADMDWILVLDADEELPEDSVDKIYQIISSPPEGEWPVFALKIINHLDDDQINEHFMMRLFPNTDYIRYEGALHEQLVSEDEIEMTKYSLQDVIIHHYGYTKEVYEKKNKLQRNREILQGLIASGEETPFDMYSMANNELADGNKSNAFHYFSAAEAGCRVQHRNHGIDFPKWRDHCLSMMISLMTEMDMLDWAKQCCETAPDTIVDRPDFWCHFGDLHFKLKDYDIAVGAYSRAINMERNVKVDFYDHKYVTWRPNAGLGNCYAAMGNFFLSLNYFKRALSYSPNNESIKHAIKEVNKLGW